MVNFVEPPQIVQFSEPKQLSKVPENIVSLTLKVSLSVLHKSETAAHLQWKQTK